MATIKQIVWLMVVEGRGRWWWRQGLLRVLRRGCLRPKPQLFQWHTHTHDLGWSKTWMRMHLVGGMQCAHVHGCSGQDDDHDCCHHQHHHHHHHHRHRKSGDDHIPVVNRLPTLITSHVTHCMARVSPTPSPALVVVVTPVVTTIIIIKTETN